MKRALLVYFVTLHIAFVGVLVKSNALDLMRYKVIAWGFMPLRDVVYIGDSITADAPVSPKIAIPGLTTRELARILARYDLQGRHVHLMIGINDVLNGIAPDFAAVSARIPGPLTWYGIIPARIADAERVREANAAIRATCARRHACAFVDTSRIASAEYFQADGLHLSAKGYAAHQGLITSTR